CARSPGYFDIW
nr:immunoglobulin heavy chain junction region [Macaca mulatta]